MNLLDRRMDGDCDKNWSWINEEEILQVIRKTNEIGKYPEGINFRSGWTNEKKYYFFVVHAVPY